METTLEDRCQNAELIRLSLATEPEYRACPHCDCGTCERDVSGGSDWSPRSAFHACDTCGGEGVVIESVEQWATRVLDCDDGEPLAPAVRAFATNATRLVALLLEHCEDGTGLELDVRRAIENALRTQRPLFARSADRVSTAEATFGPRPRALDRGGIVQATPDDAPGEHVEPERDEHEYGGESRSTGGELPRPADVLAAMSELYAGGPWNSGPWRQ